MVRLLVRAAATYSVVGTHKAHSTGCREQPVRPASPSPRRVSQARHRDDGIVMDGADELYSVERRRRARHQLKQDSSAPIFFSL
jgi:hypothetical protein